MSQFNMRDGWVGEGSRGDWKALHVSSGYTTSSGIVYKTTTHVHCTSKVRDFILILTSHTLYMYLSDDVASY